MKVLNIFKGIEIHLLIIQNMFVVFGETQILILKHCVQMIHMKIMVPALRQLAKAQYH
jgi:hypothetical protein